MVRASRVLLLALGVSSAVAVKMDFGKFLQNCGNAGCRAIEEIRNVPNVGDAEHWGQAFQRIAESQEAQDVREEAERVRQAWEEQQRQAKETAERLSTEAAAVWNTCENDAKMLLGNFQQVLSDAHQSPAVQKVVLDLKDLAQEAELLIERKGNDIAERVREVAQHAGETEAGRKVREAAKHISEHATKAARELEKQMHRAGEQARRLSESLAKEADRLKRDIEAKAAEAVRHAGAVAERIKEEAPEVARDLKEQAESQARQMEGELRNMRKALEHLEHQLRDRRAAEKLLESAKKTVKEAREKASAATEKELQKLLTEIHRITTESDLIDQIKAILPNSNHP
ncbi:unnamed protein product [Amoebophrya sp. A120]|nr:unnamed protein product [Amoebophrya sp. A120]|eukprot:GSA120T00004843001.1